MALRGLKVLEMAGLAPAPFAGLILSDFGCDVIRVDKCSPHNFDTLSRNKKSIALNLKHSEGVSLLLRLIRVSDVIIEPYRPGVMEKMGLGPDICLKEHPGLVYARLTGFGQSGPLREKAGHDINYLAISGVLSCLGPKGHNPHPPINLLGDFAGGSLMCVIGILSALISRLSTGKGQVVDSSMVDGAAYLSTFLLSTQSLGLWAGGRGSNLLDGGAHFYSVYETKDGRFIAVGALEPQFYADLLRGLELNSDELPQQMDRDSWDKMKGMFKEIFLKKNLKDWLEVFSGLDACVTPVLDLHSGEAARDNANSLRNVYDLSSEPYIPNPAPRLQATPAISLPSRIPFVGEHTHSILSERLSMSDIDIRTLFERNVVQSYPTTKL